jgi:hypothetical protein
MSGEMTVGQKGRSRTREDQPNVRNCQGAIRSSDSEKARVPEALGQCQMFVALGMRNSVPLPRQKREVL